MPDAAQVFIGVDIGGTKVGAGLVNMRGDILHKTRTPMNAHAARPTKPSLACARPSTRFDKNTLTSRSAAWPDLAGTSRSETGMVLIRRT